MSVLIVGGGLFGSIAARVCAERGLEVEVFDDERSGAGSQAAGCIVKPEWIQSLGKEKARTGLAVLDRLFGLSQMEFQTPKGYTTAYVMEPSDIFVKHTKAIVSMVGDGWILTERGRLEGTVLVAAGVWSRRLVARMPRIKALCGASFLFRGDQGAGIVTFAPYRQKVWFPRSDGTWFGDGTAIYVNNYDRELMDQRTLLRAQESGLTDPVRMFWGMRPYVGDGGYLEQFGERLWVSSGGAKNGCLLAAVQAEAFVKAIA